MGRILVVDDYPSVRQMMEYYLPTFGHTVASAPDGPTGLQLAAQEPIDLVLVDLDMPRMTGLAFCREFKRNPRWRDLPVILITGRQTQEVAAQAKEAGIVMVISKPFQWNELMDSIHHLLSLPVPSSSNPSGP